MSNVRSIRPLSLEDQLALHIYEEAAERKGVVILLEYQEGKTPRILLDCAEYGDGMGIEQIATFRDSLRRNVKTGRLEIRYQPYDLTFLMATAAVLP